MCSEPKGLPPWPRTLTRWLAVITAATIALGLLFGVDGPRKSGDHQAASGSFYETDPMGIDLH